MPNQPMSPWMRKQWRFLLLHAHHCLREAFPGDEVVEDADQADKKMSRWKTNQWRHQLPFTHHCLREFFLGPVEAEDEDADEAEDVEPNSTNPNPQLSPLRNLLP